MGEVLARAMTRHRSRAELDEDHDTAGGRADEAPVGRNFSTLKLAWNESRHSAEAAVTSQNFIH